MYITFYHCFCTFCDLLAIINSLIIMIFNFQELIPEFFYLSEMFVNSNNYKLGQLDDGLAVDNVELPPWASSPQVTCLSLCLSVCPPVY